MRPKETLKSKSVNRGFTLIELLIVVAIIAILAAIAVPNFLEAQTRSKVSRSKADMRSLITAMEAYRVDNNTTPPPLNPSIRSWWGFVPPTLSTPVAYMSSMPNMTFYDKEVIKVWKTFFGGTENNQPYTYVWDVRVINQQRTGVMQIYASADPCVPRNLLGEDATDFFNSISKSSYMIYTSGPDNCDGTVSGGMMTYDATNGTVSYGDIFFYGGGSVEDSGKSTFTVPLE